ncbi:MAG: glycosyltransferase family 4 protein [Candidatus Njordarchaeales archaeon]
METLRILWLNWKDIKHPLAGGAERYTHEICKGLVRKGHRVSLITSYFRGAKKFEEIDGVKIVRLGSLKTVYFLAFCFYMKHLRGRYDVVVEEINGNIAWLAPLYAKEPVVALRHQVEYTGLKNLYKSVLPYELPLTLATFLYLNEAIYLRLYSYLRVPFITVSKSTMRDLINAGVPSNRIHIVPNGTNINPIENIDDAQREKNPTIIFIGRLQRSKGVFEVIKAYKFVKKEVPNAQLWIIGDGYLKPTLEKIAKKTRGITIFGRVDDRVKEALLKKAHILVAPSVREGWGQVVIEANACGVPVVAYDVPGLRDSILDGKTGALIKDYGNTRALAKAIIEILENDALWKELSKNAVNWAKNFSWDKSVDMFERVLEKTLRASKQ